MADFAQLLRQRRIAPLDSPLGMPNIDTSDPFRGVMSLAEEAKNQDLRRRKELMQFESDLQRQEEAPARMRAMIERGKQLDPARKNYVLGAGSGSGKLPPSTVIADNAANDAKAAAINQEFANVNLKRDELRAGRESEERIANRKIDAVSAENATERDFKSQEAKSAREGKGWQPFNVPDPEDPNKQIPVRMNLATGQVERVDSGPLTKPGTKPPVGGVDPKVLSGIRQTAQTALDAIDDLVDEKGNLSNHAKWAVGGSRLFGLTTKIPASEAKKGDVSINYLKSNLVLDLIAQMKAQSKTGATGFGNMNLRELGTLESAIGRLDPNQDEATFAKELGRIRQHLRKIMEDPPETNPNSKPSSPDDYIKKYGGRV